MSQGVLQTYQEFLPITPTTPMITLGEGDTPLVQSHRMAKELGLEQLYFKLEGCNPTGSFKDRGMVMAVANALEQESKTIICASTGNTSASAAAYGAHCNLSTVVLVPKGNVARGKIAQAIAYGAHILVINGSFDRALAMVRELSSRHPIALVNSVNPYRIEGQKTAAFEVADALGDAPDYLCIPVGNAGNITAYWKGFKEYQQTEHTTRSPQMFGFQAEGAAPIVRGEIVENPETIATAIRIGNPASWQTALEARDESGEDRRYGGEDERPPVHLQIEGHPTTNRRREIDRAEPVCCPPRRQRAARTAQQRQEDALGEQLPHQARPRRAESRPQGHLPLTSDATADQQRGDVGAGDQQHE